MRALSRPTSRLALALTLVVAIAVALAHRPAGAANGATHTTVVRRAAVVIHAVGAENEYADVLTQIGGSHVTVTGIISNPNTDPHSYESSTKDAGAVAQADVIVQNGMGYDSFMDKLTAASPNSHRVVLSVGESVGFHTGDNPHIWYDPTTMPYVAAWAAATFARLDPADAPIFWANLRTFDASMSTYTNQLLALKKRFAGTPVAVTEPVFGYALQAAGFTVLTPTSFQLAIMEGNDPAPQDMQIEENLIIQKKVRLFAYNQQAVAPVTAKLLPLAHRAHIPVVGVYETKPTSMSYQHWMLAEMNAVNLALSKGTSTEQVH